jgi:hypothetical protein
VGCHADGRLGTVSEPELLSVVGMELNVVMKRKKGRLRLTREQLVQLWLFILVSVLLLAFAVYLALTRT